MIPCSFTDNFFGQCDFFHLSLILCLYSLIHGSYLSLSDLGFRRSFRDFTLILALFLFSQLDMGVCASDCRNLILRHRDLFFRVLYSAFVGSISVWWCRALGIL